MKLKYTVIFTEEVHNLADYEAQSLAEAAMNAAQWAGEGSLNIGESIATAGDVTVTVEALA